MPPGLCVQKIPSGILFALNPMYYGEVNSDETRSCGQDQ